MTALPAWSRHSVHTVQGNIESYIQGTHMSCKVLTWTDQAQATELHSKRVQNQYCSLEWLPPTSDAAAETDKKDTHFQRVCDLAIRSSSRGMRTFSLEIQSSRAGKFNLALVHYELHTSPFCIGGNHQSTITPEISQILSSELTDVGRVWRGQQQPRSVVAEFSCLSTLTDRLKICLYPCSLLSHSDHALLD